MFLLGYSGFMGHIAMIFAIFGDMLGRIDET